MARRSTSAQALALRCRIVLACAEGRRNVEVGRRLGVHDEPRPGKPHTIGDEDVERVIIETLEETPVDATHWSTRSMATATVM